MGSAAAIVSRRGAANNKRRPKQERAAAEEGKRPKRVGIVMRRERSRRVAETTACRGRTAMWADNGEFPPKKPRRHRRVDGRSRERGESGCLTGFDELVVQARRRRREAAGKGSAASRRAACRRAWSMWGGQRPSGTALHANSGPQSRRRVGHRTQRSGWRRRRAPSRSGRRSSVATTAIDAQRAVGGGQVASPAKPSRPTIDDIQAIDRRFTTSKRWAVRFSISESSSADRLLRRGARIIDAGEPAAAAPLIDDPTITPPHSGL